MYYKEIEQGFLVNKTLICLLFFYFKKHTKLRTRDTCKIACLFEHFFLSIHIIIKF